MKTLLGTSALALAFTVTAGINTAVAQDSQQQNAQQNFCEQNWTAVDANHDGRVSRQEVDNASKIEFGAIDQDGDGTLTKAEFQECIERGMQGFSMAEADPLPADGTKIEATQAELPDDAEQQQGGSTQQASADSSESDDPSARVFDPAVYEALQRNTGDEDFKTTDADADAKVSPEEYGQAAGKAYSSVYGMPADDAGGESQQADDQQQAADQQREAMEDPENVVMLRRYIWLVPSDLERQQPMTRDEAAARSAMQFGALDENRDQQLGQEEFQSTATPTPMDEQELSRAMEMLDANNDGEIGYEEYRQHRQMAFEEAMQKQQQARTEEGAADDQPADAQPEGVPLFIYRIYTL